MQRELVERKEKEDAAGNVAPQPNWHPTMREFYNIGMGATDLNDQLGQYYRSIQAMAHCELSGAPI